MIDNTHFILLFEEHKSNRRYSRDANRVVGCTRSLGRRAQSSGEMEAEKRSVGKKGLIRQEKTGSGPGLWVLHMGMFVNLSSTCHQIVAFVWYST